LIGNAERSAVVRKHRDGVVTVNDVAARAGVSPGTVSKALNGRGQLRTETRRRVLLAAQELGFHASVLSRGLTADRTYTVGVLTTDSFGRFTIPVMLGAEDALGAGSDLGAALRRPRRSHSRTALRTHPHQPTGGRHHRHGTHHRPPPTLGRDLPIPIVYARARSDHPDDLSLLHDDQQGAGLAIRHLLATGRSRIATSPDRIDTWPRGTGPSVPRRRSHPPDSAWCLMNR
jgi:LacI family transcriptional regulator